MRKRTQSMPPMKPLCGKFKLPAFKHPIRYCIGVGTLISILIGWTLYFKHRPQKETPSPTNPVYSHSLDLRDLGAPADALVGSFSLSPDGKRMGIITTTPGGNPSQMLLCDLDGKNAVIAPTGNWEHRAPLWCSNHRIVTGTSRCTHTGKPADTESFSFHDAATGKTVTGTKRSTETSATTYSLTVWDAQSGKIVSELVTEGIYFAGAVNPTNRSEVVLLPHPGGWDRKDFPVSLRKWNIDTGTLTILPQTGLFYDGVTWLADGDILAYGCAYPTKSVVGPDNSMLSHGDTVVVRLDAYGGEIRRIAQPVYKAYKQCRSIKQLGVMVQPHSPATPHAGSGIWPVSTPVGAWVDVNNLKIVDKQAAFDEFGGYANMVTGAAVVSVDGQYIYFSKTPDIWVYNPTNQAILKSWRTATGHGLAITPDSQFLLAGNNRRIDFYRLKP